MRGCVAPMAAFAAGVKSNYAPGGSGLKRSVAGAGFTPALLDAAGVGLEADPKGRPPALVGDRLGPT